MPYRMPDVGRALQKGSAIGANRTANALNLQRLQGNVEERQRAGEIRGAAREAYVPGQGLDPQRFAQGLEKLGHFIEADAYRRGQRQDEQAQAEYMMKSFTAMQKVFGLANDQATLDLARTFMQKVYPDHPVTQKIPEVWDENAQAFTRAISGQAQVERAKLAEMAGETREVKSGDEIVTQERGPQGQWGTVATAPRFKPESEKPTYKTDAQGNLLAVTGTTAQPVTTPGRPGQPERPGPYQNAIGLPGGGIGLPGQSAIAPQPVQVPTDTDKPAEQRMIEMIMQEQGVDFQTAFTMYRTARSDPLGAVVKVARILADAQELSADRKSPEQLMAEAQRWVRVIQGNLMGGNVLTTEPPPSDPNDPLGIR